MIHTIYTFENTDGGEIYHSTADYKEATAYATAHRYRIIANTLTLSESESVADYTPENEVEE